MDTRDTIVRAARRFLCTHRRFVTAGVLLLLLASMGGWRPRAQTPAGEGAKYRFDPSWPKPLPSVKDAQGEMRPQSFGRGWHALHRLARSHLPVQPALHRIGAGWPSSRRPTPKPTSRHGCRRSRRRVRFRRQRGQCLGRPVAHTTRHVCRVAARHSRLLRRLRGQRLGWGKFRRHRPEMVA